MANVLKEYVESAVREQLSKVRELQLEIENLTFIRFPERTKGSYQYPTLGVGIELSHLDRSWDYSNDILPKEDSFMLPENIWVDFANLIRSDKKIYNCAGKRIPVEVIRALRSNIFDLKNLYRAEWINNKFGKGTTTYPKFNSAGKLEFVTEPLEDCLMEDRVQGISLDDWLKNPTPQGFPRKDVKKGDLYYQYPRDGRVARFFANSVRAVLNCYGNPQGSVPELGVRRAKIFKSREDSCSHGCRYG